MLNHLASVACFIRSTRKASHALKWTSTHVLIMALSASQAASLPDAQDPSTMPAHPQVQEVWTRHSMPVLEPSQPWEFSPGSQQGFVAEPSVLYDAEIGQYTMWYSGGWERCATGVAVSSDGINWRKHTANPILGQGKFDMPVACRNFVLKHEGQVYIYFSDSIGDKPGTIYVTHSSDGINNLSVPVPILTPGDTDINLANSWAVFNGKHWKIFYDSMTEPPRNIWRTFSATCESPLGPCSKDPGPLKGLQLSDQGVYGAGWAHLHDGSYDTYYLANYQGHVDTPIYHACQASVESVRLGNQGKPVVNILPGHDQTGDPFLIDGAELPDGISRMWVTDVHNPSGHATIALTTYDGPLSNIDCPNHK